MVVYIVTLVFLSIFFLSLSPLFVSFVALLPNEDIVHSKCGGEATPRLRAISTNFFFLPFFNFSLCAFLK